MMYITSSRHPFLVLAFIFWLYFSLLSTFSSICEWELVLNFFFSPSLCCLHLELLVCVSACGVKLWNSLHVRHKQWQNIQVQTVASKNGLVRVFGEWVVNLGRYSLWLVLMWLLIPYHCWHIVHSHWWYTVLVSLITIDKWCFFSFPFLSACLIPLLVLLFSMAIVCMDVWCCVTDDEHAPFFKFTNLH